MAWKKDEKGQFVADSNGNPVWTNDAGEDAGVDYAGLVKRLSEVNAESKGRKEKLRQAEEKLAVFDGIEDLRAWRVEADKALEALKNTPDKDKELEAQIAGRIESATASLKAQIAAKDKTLAERDKALAEQGAKMRGLLIDADVHNSKLLSERVKPEFRPLLLRELVRAGNLDDDGKVYYRNAEGKPIYNEKGEYATREEAPLSLLKELGIDSATVLLSKDGGTTGSNGKPDGGSPFNPGSKKYSEMTMEEKIAWMKNDNNLKQRGS